MGKAESAKKFFRDNFLSGLLVVVPVSVSIYVFYHVMKWLYGKLVFLPIDNERLAALISPVIPEWGVFSAIKLVHVAEFIVILLALVIITSLAGLFTKIRFVNWLFGIGERTLEKIPLLGMVYSALKQLLQAIFAGKGSFKKVVLVEFPKQGVWSVGFISRESDAMFEELTGADTLYNIFIPTTPNFTTGFLVIAPREQFIELDISIDQAFKFIISGGMVLPHEEAAEVLAEGESIFDRIRGGQKGKDPAGAESERK